MSTVLLTIVVSKTFNWSNVCWPSNRIITAATKHWVGQMSVGQMSVWPNVCWSNVCQPKVCWPNVCLPNIALPNACWWNVSLPNVCWSNVCWPTAFLPDVCEQNICQPNVCWLNVDGPNVCGPNVLVITVSSKHFEICLVDAVHCSTKCVSAKCFWAKGRAPCSLEASSNIPTLCHPFSDLISTSLLSST